LQALSRRMSLADDVNLEAVAAACEFFSGADLKALLYNSQLSAINETDVLRTNCSDILDTNQNAGILLLNCSSFCCCAVKCLHQFFLWDIHSPASYGMFTVLHLVL